MPEMNNMFEEKYFPHYILPTDQISLSDWLYFLRCWVICLLQLFFVQFETSQILKLTIAFFYQVVFQHNKKKIRTKMEISQELMKLFT